MAQINHLVPQIAVLTTKNYRVRIFSSILSIFRFFIFHFHLLKIFIYFFPILFQFSVTFYKVQVFYSTTSGC